MTDDRIPAPDLALVQPGQEDTVLIVQGARIRRAPASGLPANAAITSRVDAIEAGQGSGVIGYATKATMDADLSPTAGAVAKVTNDATASNNGEYRKTGGSGTGSWVKSAYDPKTEVIQMGDLLRNRGANFPLRPMTRSGVTSGVMTPFNNSILRVEVIGARAGKYYRLSFFKNGAALSGPQDGWIITEYPADTYATAAVETQVMHYTHAAPDIPRSGTVETVRLSSPVVSGLEFIVSVDTSQLPSLGSSIDANSNNTRPAWSWIIDPSCYVYERATFGGGAASLSGVYVSGDMATKSFKVVIPMGRTHLVRLTLQPNGKNGLFNIRRVERAIAAPIALAAWTVMSDSDTDWVPPMIVRAAAGGDGSETHYYTGGNHGSDGSAGGVTTASLDFLACDVDGRQIGTSETIEGFCAAATFRWSNSLYGYNTITLARSVVRQWITMQCTAHGVEVLCTIEPLEAIVVENDNGPQMLAGGFSTTCHYYAGSTASRQALADAVSSGTKAAAPGAWATVLGSTNGFQASWIDRAFDAGDGRYVGSANPLMRKNASIDKFYHAVVAGAEAALAVGSGYSWRGGYSWVPAGYADYFDSAFVHAVGGKPWIGWAALSAGTGLIKPPALYSGREVNGQVISAIGYRRVAAGYEAPRYPVI